MGSRETADFLVVGGGVVGLTIALELRSRHPKATILVLEKERDVGAHASGRNSGVVHAGFYYSADSLKARLTRRGNVRLTAWCEEHGLAINKCGKLVVARGPHQLDGLEELARRGACNDVPVELVSAEEAREIEPLAATYERALWSPSTSAVDPSEIMASLVAACARRDVDVRLGVAWRGVRADVTHTSRGEIAAGYVVNAAGMYADRVATAHGFGHGLTMLPFKGLYLYGNRSAPRLRVHVYPVPDLGMPFLGVHFTVTVTGAVKIGPTAFPAPWREGYGWDAHSRSRFVADELAEVARSGLALFASDASFRRHAFREAPKLTATHLVEEASALVPEIRPSQFDRWGRPGIRAQLYDREARRLVMDFRYEGDDRSAHVLNAVSPAFTCSFAFAERVVDDIERWCGHDDEGSAVAVDPEPIQHPAKATG
ncbi:MAG: FAD-dependent oxidoreductase [Myxococcota bacterium]